MDPDVESSDDEVFFGEFTFKEALKRIGLSSKSIHARQTVGYPPKINIENRDMNESLKLIETHSAPDISSSADTHVAGTSNTLSPISSPYIASDWDKSEDSFLRMEQMVSSLSVTPAKCNVESIPASNKYFFKNQSKSETDIMSPAQLSEPTARETNSKISSESTPQMPNLVIKKAGSDESEEEFRTPSNKFKTPRKPVSNKKFKTPRKYENVMSPVANYINNCPQSTLITNVHPNPKKTLSGVSFIPKLKPVSKLDAANKENCNQVDLPKIGYKSAKVTKLIEIPDDKKLPQSQWAKKQLSSIPKVITHTQRSVSSSKKPIQYEQDESFQDLSIKQADLSLCTKKSVVRTPKK